MCVANSARSQIAEGLARELLGPGARVESAGSEPKQVNSYAIRVLREIGIDISLHRAKTVDDLAPAFVANLDYVVTLCAEEVCPAVIAPRAKRLHWPLPDPAAGSKSEAEFIEQFRLTRNQLMGRLREFADGIKIST